MTNKSYEFLLLSINKNVGLFLHRFHTYISNRVTLDTSIFYQCRESNEKSREKPVKLLNDYQSENKNAVQCFFCRIFEHFYLIFFSIFNFTIYNKNIKLDLRLFVGVNVLRWVFLRVN